MDFFDNLLDDQKETPTTEPVVEETPPVTEEKEVSTTETSEEEPAEETVEETITDENPWYQFLKQHGIVDPSKIQMSDEDGTVGEYDFNTLPSEDQLAIIESVTDAGLSETEINAINYLRQNGNVSLEQVVDYWANKRLDEYLQANPDAIHAKTYEIDDYTDDDLYLIDLKSRFPKFTDEELMSQLQAAKSNEDLFKKETEVIRATYKEREDAAAAAVKQQEEQQIKDLRNNLANAAQAFNEVPLDYKDEKSDSLVIEEGDKQQMLAYILDQDSEGKSQLVRDLENPDALIELAWLRTKGADILSDMTQYWKKLLADERSTNRKLQSQIDKLKKGSSSVIAPQNKESMKTEGSVWDNSGLI